MSLAHPTAYQSDALPYAQMGAGPAHQNMDATPLGNPSPGLVMQQRNGWCDCRLGFSIQPFTSGVPPQNSSLPPPSLSMWQSGSFCGRIFTCNPTFKVFNGDVNLEQMDNEAALAQRVAYSLEKPLCVCCPQMLTKDSAGVVIGRTVRQCTLCLPSYAIENMNGQTVYTVSPDSFLFCFPKCNMGGSGACCQIPWYIRQPATGDHLPNDPHIMHVWTGMRREFCTPNTTVRCQYPQGASVNDKATLLGSTLLITLQAVQEAKEQNESFNN